MCCHESPVRFSASKKKNLFTLPIFSSIKKRFLIKEWINYTPTMKIAASAQEIVEWTVSMERQESVRHLIK